MTGFEEEKGETPGFICVCGQRKHPGHFGQKVCLALLLAAMRLVEGHGGAGGWWPGGQWLLLLAALPPEQTSLFRSILCLAGL